MKEKVKPRNSIVRNVLFVLRSIREFDPHLLTWILLNAVFTALGNMVPIVMPKLIVDELTTGGSVNRVIILAVIFGAAMFISNGITAMTYGTAPPIPSGSLSIRFIALRMRFHARQNLKNMSMDFQNLEDPEILDMASKATRAMESNYTGLEGMSRLVVTSFRSLLTLIGTLSVILVMGYWVLLATIAVLAVNYLVSNRARKRDKQVQDSLTSTNRKISYMEDMTNEFGYGKDIRLFGMKDFILKKFTNEQAKQFKGRSSILRFWLFSGHIQSVTALLQEIVMYTWLCWRVIAGSINIGSFLMYITSIRTFSVSLGGLLDDYSSLQQQSAVINDYRAYTELPDSPSGTDMPPEGIRHSGAEIEFEHVSFRYPGSESYALSDVSFKIKVRGKLAVVGLNGAGKSTFIKLLMRLYTPESGRILLGGIDIQTYARDAYFRLFSAVFQEINTFAFTIAENVSLCEYEKTDIERVKRSLELAGLSEKIASLPKGIDTAMLKNLEKDGVEFSGGETQKLALARALYKDAPLIVLDEPTAALDALAEERLYREFDKLSRDKTAIYISHRLASTRFCDRVVMFDNGKITECGTHDELLISGGKYAELFNVQAQYYRDDEKTEVTA
jgi:ABC-type multidrug transport system fused ATPase/permease subunit